MSMSSMGKHLDVMLIANKELQNKNTLLQNEIKKRDIINNEWKVILVSIEEKINLLEQENTLLK